MKEIKRKWQKVRGRSIGWWGKEVFSGAATLRILKPKGSSYAEERGAWQGASRREVQQGQERKGLGQSGPEAWEPFPCHASCESPRVRGMISIASQMKHYRRLKWACQLSY